jgi:hypothetical protein
MSKETKVVPFVSEGSEFSGMKALFHLLTPYGRIIATPVDWKDGREWCFRIDGTMVIRGIACRGMIDARRFENGTWGLCNYFIHRGDGASFNFDSATPGQLKVIREILFGILPTLDRRPEVSPFLNQAEIAEIERDIERAEEAIAEQRATTENLDVPAADALTQIVKDTWFRAWFD